MKMVPVRAVTLTRKREVEEAEREGEKLMQGLYALHQTDWIIPPPIRNGIIPKNAFGNSEPFLPDSYCILACKTCRMSEIFPGRCFQVEKG